MYHYLTIFQRLGSHCETKAVSDLIFERICTRPWIQLIHYLLTFLIDLFISVSRYTEGECLSGRTFAEN